MIVYSPTEGLPLSIHQNHPRCGFLITQLATPVPELVTEIRTTLKNCCAKQRYKLLDAHSRITGKDFLIKIWQFIASTPLSIGLVHECMPAKTLYNIYYELGIAQALGKETLLIKSPKSEIPSDLIRTEYIEFNQNFDKKIEGYFQTLVETADYYITLSDQLEKDPILALDYLKRAYLITGEETLKEKAMHIINDTGLKERAKNSIEHQLAYL